MSRQSMSKRPGGLRRRLGIIALSAALAIWMLAAASPAQAMPCGPRDALVGWLTQTHKEKPTAIGLTSTGRLMEIFAAANGNWTILVTRPTGQSCVVATGQAWSAIIPDKPSA